MSDPWGSLEGFMKGFSQLASDPAGYAMSHFGVTKDLANNPDAIIERLMGSGRISQQQYNMARKMALQIQNNPLFSRFVK